MVRKHYSWTRARMSRSRPKTPAPTNGWLMADLSRISAMPVRRLRDYVFRDLIQPIERRGTATRYDRSQLVRLMAIKRMRSESELELAEIRRRMDAMGERELEAWILTGPLPAAVLEALGRSPAAVKPAKSGAASALPNPALGVTSGEQRARARAASAGPEVTLAENPAFATWQHVQLLPGLVLQLSAKASPAVRAAAKRICDEYVGE
jgi:DNA-binding transcriptional MerR regulator